MDKQIKELNLRIGDFELAMSRDPSKSSQRLESKISELTSQLDRVNREKDELQFSARKSDRLVRDLQFQLAEKDKTRSRQDEEVNRLNEKLKRMKDHMTEMVDFRS